MRIKKKTNDLLFEKYTHLQINLVSTGDSTESPVYDVLQLNLLHTGRLMFQLVGGRITPSELVDSVGFGVGQPSRAQMMSPCVVTKSLQVYRLAERTDQLLNDQLINSPDPPVFGHTETEMYDGLTSEITSAQEDDCSNESDVNVYPATAHNKIYENKR
ncbi:hypothetical protein T265_06363 [Opisthorchis viverrini]|uniref:Uncharacterized protein n=1 Tax=Opisthorchis viverrini TaxID=6198 RepID=A0A074ZSN4_OPIVI|nr:hypothetical protein T265_06363 [Opisthorchis viverrini]KER26380.1 hypothetical protein T265_06363 [Opisthorchis viverrini]